MMKDNRGLAFTLDIMNALIILTVLLGITAQAMDNIYYKMGEDTYTSSLDRITVHTAEILINTPGSPENWEEKDTMTSVSPGLAQQDSKDKTIRTPVISYKKLIKLRDNYQTLVDDQILPDGVKSSLILYPTDPSLDLIQVKSESATINTVDLYQVNKTVLLDRSYNVLVSLIPSNRTNYEKCNHQQISGTDSHKSPNYSKEAPGWVCNYFSVNSTLRSNSDFYLMTSPVVINDPAAGWIIDSPLNESEDLNNFGMVPLNINNEIEMFSSPDNNSILWLHVFTSGRISDSFETYIVAVPKGTSPTEIKTQFLKLCPYYFVLKIGN